jgi:hypothetical protein
MEKIAMEIVTKMSSVKQAFKYSSLSDLKPSDWILTKEI